MRVDFKDGQWAEIHAPGEMPRLVTVRLQDMLIKSSAHLDDEDKADRYRAMQNMERMRDTLMAMVIKDWSYDFDRSEEGAAEDVYQLPQDSYDQLKRETHEHWEKAGFTETIEEEEKPKAKRSRAGSTSNA
jgi:hypothetical protein